VNPKIRTQLDTRKRRIERRLDKHDLRGMERPMFTATNFHYEIADRTRGLSHGGIGAIHALVRHLGLVEAIDERLHLLKIHLPFHESDHVLNFAYNAFCEGTCLQDIELRRNDEVYLDALGARRIPDPTTAGDFCRRFTEADIRILQEVFHDIRIRVWAQQPREFFDCAIIEMDGTMVPTTGCCKAGMDISHEGIWGYHPLAVTLANTGEVLSIVNRSGNRPSHEGSPQEADRCMAVCFRGGFRRVLLRGDTDFSQTAHFDRWDADGRIGFLFGYDAMANVKACAEDLPPEAWEKLERPERPEPTSGRQRQRPANAKDAIVRQRGYTTLRLKSEEVAEFPYRPGACGKDYRMVVIRKNISKEKGEARLLDEVRYYFYITNDRVSTQAEVVFAANDRCNQENLLAQLHSGCHALRAPVNDLVSNWAYMVMTALAWNLKAWWALQLPEGRGRHREAHRREKRWVQGLEFKTFVQAFVRLPCQLVRTGRRLIYRLLSWNPHQRIFFRWVAALRC
jgi:hypothetical protein